MTQPSHGKITYNGNNWSFVPQNQTTNSIVNFQHFDRDIHHLIQTFQLFKNHVPFWKIWQAKSSFNLGKIVARHVSARGLSSADVPSLINHNKLNPQDKEIWNAAYSEEYYGLKNLPAWRTISDKEYQLQKSTLGPLLPTMAISTIKYDELGKPKRAKYRIVALGNLDPHSWTKADCYAPVMSLMELRLITALAVKHNKVLKSGDFKQAFCQATFQIGPPQKRVSCTPLPFSYSLLVWHPLSSRAQLTF